MRWNKRKRLKRCIHLKEWKKIHADRCVWCRPTIEEYDNRRARAYERNSNNANKWTFEINTNDLQTHLKRLDWRAWYDSCCRITSAICYGITFFLTVCVSRVHLFFTLQRSPIRMKILQANQIFKTYNSISFCNEFLAKEMFDYEKKSVAK